MKTPRILTAGIAAFLLTTTPTFSATWTWDGGAGNDNWTNGQNWVGDVGPVNNGTADIVFAGATRLIPNLSIPWSLNSVTFNNTAGLFTLNTNNGSTLTIGAGGITNNSSSAQFIQQHQITLSAPQTWTAVGSLLSIEGPQSAVNNGGHLLTINADAPQFFLLTVISGSGGLTKNGLGTLSLSTASPNTYTGLTTVNAGDLYLQSEPSANAIPGSIVVGDGVGTDVDRLRNYDGHQIADGATVNINATGAWLLEDNAGIGISSETISHLNIASTGVAGGALVTVGNGTVAILGNLTMTGGTVATYGSGKLSLNGSLITHATSITASISSQLDLGGGARIFTIADGAASNDLNVTGVMSNGAIHMDGPGALRLGAANTYTGGTTLNGGIISIGHDLALGTGPVTGNGGALQADGAGRTIANTLVGSFGVDGAFDLTLNSALNLSGGITKNGLGTLIFPQVGVIAGVLTANTGSVRFNANFTVAGGLTNSATVLIGSGTLTVNGTGFDNEGSLALAGGALGGSGPVVNNGLISGSGTLGGTGGFTNNAQLTVGGGNFTLANAGPNVNAGNVTVSAGLQLRLTGGTLANAGTVDLAGGIVTGTAMLSNNTGGTVSGRGLISAPFANAGGTLYVAGGTMNVPNAFTNSGVIRLDSGTLGGAGSIQNTGIITGGGTVSKAVTNSAGGQLRAEAGRTLYLTSNFGTNAGTFSLEGGTLEFSSAVTNGVSGTITGFGALRSALLTNSGNIGLSGDARFYGDVTNATGARIITSGGSTTTFYDDVVHNGTEIRTSAGGASVFFGAVSGAGPFTGTGTVYFEGDLRPGNSPASVLYEGDLVFGGASSLTLEIGGLVSGSEHDHLDIGGALHADGDLVLALLDGFTPQLGDTFDLLDVGTFAGDFDSITAPALSGGNSWDFSALKTTGSVTVVPEPGVATLLLTSLSLLGLRRRR